MQPPPPPTQPPTEDLTLDYRMRGPATAAPHRIFSVTAFVISALMYSVIALDLALVVRHFEMIFKDFGVKLPLLTQLLLTASRWFRDIGWLVLLPMPVVVGFVVGLLVKPQPRDPHRTLKRFSTAMIVMLLLGVILVVTLLGLFLPMITLIQAVSGTGK